MDILPIPNREVKPLSADDTAERWESAWRQIQKACEKSQAFFYALFSRRFLFSVIPEEGGYTDYFPAELAD